MGVGKKAAESSRSHVAQSPAEIRRQTGDDALCFTAGFGGGVFGLGVLHAYLAADRKPPAIAAGISYGAYSATAAQQCYRQLTESPHFANEILDAAEEGRIEATRWRAFRPFLWGLLDKPFESIWRAIPDRSDFFAGYRTLTDPATPSELRQRESFVARRRDLLVSFGRWIYDLPLKVRTVMRAVVNFVLWKDGMVRNRDGDVNRFRTWLLRQLHGCILLLRLVGILERLAWTNCLRPSYVDRLRGRTIRPLFGLRLWLASVLMVASSIAAMWSVWRLLGGLFVAAKVTYWVGTWLGVWFLSRAATLVLHRPLLRWLENYLGRKMGMQGGLLDDFHLLLKLRRLVGSDTRIDSDPFPIVISAACLQVLASQSGKATEQLLYARPGAPLASSLLAALRPSVLFGPQTVGKDELQKVSKDKLQTVEKDELRHWLPDWLKPAGKRQAIDLIAGDALRQNPLPALFAFLRRDHFAGDGRVRPGSVASRLLTAGDECRPSIHVVYQVPLEPSRREVDEGADNEGRRRDNNLVDLGALGIRLARRRDTQMEVRTTNFISRLEAACVDTGIDLGRSDFVLPPLFADEIAPESEISFKNPLEPNSRRSLEYVAQGCRRTLEKLYGEQLAGLADKKGLVRCRNLLAQVTPRRDRVLADDHASPGLSEVCAACQRTCAQMLQAPAKDDDGHAFEREPTSDGAGELLEQVRSLGGDEPRIVVLLSGGVFRGSFHVGLIAALAKAGIRPDLVAGASVGTLIGGALGSLFAVRDRPDVFSEKLETLVGAFVHVDTRVALTRRLLNAVRQLSTRGSRMDLAPRAIRKILLQGRRNDPSYAATGVPGPLADGLSMLFLFPLEVSRAILTSFLGGRHTEAADSFWEAVKQGTLPRLYVERSFLGASLLRTQVQKLLDIGKPSDRHQPFADVGIAFLATATNLESESLELFGAQNPGSFSFVDATLASSAFPTAFSPVRESEIKPGLGRTDLRYGDGGMFDNLPILPSLRTLALCQELRLLQKRPDPAAGECTEGLMEALERRHQRPDLLLVGALDVNLDRSRSEDFRPDSVRKVLERTRALRANDKIRGFQNSSVIIDQLISKLLKSYELMTEAQQQEWLKKHRSIVARTVDASILPVFPSDQNHLNPTFAFCASLGLDRARMRRSIADGCFQTFRALAHETRGRDTNVRERALFGLRDLGRIPWVEPRRLKLFERFTSDGRCPFFQLKYPAATKKLDPSHSASEIGADGTFRCPFVGSARGESLAVYKQCCADRTHHELIEDLSGGDPEQLAQAEAVVNQPSEHLESGASRV